MGTNAQALEHLQRRLQDIYEINVVEDVNDFLITDRDTANALRPGPALRNAREQLLLREDADSLNLALYLDAGVLDRLPRDGTGPTRGAADLNGFCLALEGVSHFLYLVWHATRARSVSLLEMELQAEIDKYVLIREVIDEGVRVSRAPDLIPRLFGAVAYHPELDAVELRRYRAANRCAERYCRRLESEYYGVRSRRDLLNELRRFYRLPGRDKLLAAAASC